MIRLGIANRLQSGLSLIELMISLVVASTVTMGLVQMFTGTREGSQLLVGQATVAESGRFALQLITRSIRQAGYRGCNSKSALDDNVSDVPFEFDLATGVQGYNATDDVWLPDIASTLPQTYRGGESNIYLGSGINTRPYDNCLVSGGCLKNGTDILTLAFADRDYVVDITNFPVPTGTEDIVINGILDDVEKDFEQHHIVLIDDCNTRDSFVITAMSATGHDQTRLQHNIGGYGTTRNRTALLGEGQGYKAGSRVMVIESHTYFIGAGLSKNRHGDRVDALFRKAGTDAPRELVEGIEDMQILYGLDTGGEALVPDTYVDAGRVTDFSDVITIRVELIANSIDDVGSLDADGIARRTFSQTVHLRNRLNKK